MGSHARPAGRGGRQADAHTRAEFLRRTADRALHEVHGADRIHRPLRQAEDESARWLSAESELRAVLRGLSAANAIRRYRIARAVQQAYKISRALAGQEEFSDLVPHVETMSRIKNRRRTKPAATAPEPQKQ